MEDIVLDSTWPTSLHLQYTYNILIKNKAYFI